MMMHKELLRVMNKYPDYKIKGMMYDETNTSWAWLTNIHINHETQCIELMFGYIF